MLDGDRWKPAFPHARYVFPKIDFDFWKPTNAHTVGPQVGGQVNTGVFENRVEPIAKERLVDFVDGIEEIGDGLRLVPSPSHTLGKCACT
jgi:hypothetical protein